MGKDKMKKSAVAGMLCAIAVVGSLFSFPVFASKCAPVQHMVNVICAVFLGPAYGIAVAFAASLLRNLLGLGSLMAYPGICWCAALRACLLENKKIVSDTVGRIFGTAMLGGLSAYPVAVLLMGQNSGKLRFMHILSRF